MLVYNMDVEPRSRWLRTTPGAAVLSLPARCTEAGLFYGNAHFSTARSDKESYIVFYTLSGCGLIEQNGARILLAPGQTLLLNCRAPQSYCTNPGAGHWHHYWAHIDGAGVAAMAPFLNASRLAPAPLPELTAKAHFEALLQRIERADTLSVLLQSQTIQSLLTDMARETLGSSADASNRVLMEHAADFMREHYAEPLDLDTLLAGLHISKSYFLRLFRQYMGTTPYNFLVCCRITHAKELLVTTDLAVGEIARRTGFINESNFSYRFSAMAGESPLRYRRFSQGKA